MSLPTITSRQKPHGFTLIELLVAMSVLIAITFMVTNLVSNVSITTRMGGISTEGDSVARSFFTRLGSDLDGMIIRDDIRYGFLKNNASGNRDDIIAFLSNVDNNSGVARPLSLVSYERFGITGTPPDPIAMRRAVRGVVDTTGTGNPAWTAPIFVEAGNVVLNSPSDQIVGSVVLNNTDFQSFGAEIIRIEFSFIEKLNTGEIITRAVPPANIRDLRGIVVAIAVLDNNTLSTLSTADLATLTSALVDSDTTAVIEGNPASGEALSDIVGVWRQNLRTIASGSLERAASNTRLYQRVFFFQQ